MTYSCCHLYLQILVLNIIYKKLCDITNWQLYISSEFKIKLVKLIYINKKLPAIL